MEQLQFFDYSMVAGFCKCRRYFFYRYVLGYTLKSEMAAPEFGKAIHKALDMWYKDKDIDKAVEIFKASYTNTENDDKRTPEMGEWILRNYNETYKNQPMKLVASELSGDVMIGEDKFVYRIDKIVDWDGTLWVMDHKTTSQLGAQYGKMTDPNGQLLGYTYAAKKLGYNVIGCLIDALLVAKGLLPGKSKSNSLSPTGRYDLYVSEGKLAEWQLNFKNCLREIKDCFSSNRWTMGGMFNGACTYYGECPFRRVCVEAEDIKHKVFETDFVVEHWDPRKEI